MSKKAFYPGSFDPITNGHVDIVQRALRIFDELVIGIGVHHGKTPLLNAEQRIKLIEEVIRPLADAENATLQVVIFDNLVIDAMHEHQCQIMIRGLRDTTDYNYEMQLFGMNSELDPDLQVVFLPSSPEVRHISASLVKQIALMDGDISGFVPTQVNSELLKALRG